MSEMPKKKSCFQITSVTQAQVAASCITDDTESLDDPDESRTEDASSEIYDVFHADLGVRERSSSKETLNINGEPQELLLPSTDPFNEGASYKIIGTGQLTASNSGGSLSGPATVPPTVSTTHSLTVINPGPAVSANVAHTASVNTNCSSRFRVIKLDHSSGEPLRRGRWMCTEFYERDSDLNIHRAVDGIKTTLTLYCSTERDSGLGTTINSVVSSTGLSLQAFENTDGAFSLEHPSHLITSEPLQQGYSLAPQLGSGSSAFHSTGYTTMPSEKLQQAQGTIQPVASQILHSYILNGVHQGALQNSPSMPPATQTQQLSYSTNGVSTGQQDYEQQHFGSSTQRPSAPSHSAWSQSSQVVSPELASASQMAQELDGEVFLARGIQLQGGNSSALAPILTGSEEQQHTNQTQSSRSFGISLASSRSSNGDVPNTFAIVTSTSLDGGLVQPQSAQVGILTSLPSSLGNHTEDHKHTSDSPPQANAVGRAGVKPLFTEGLGLATPSVNSLFGIRIAMNDDEDSTSGASVVAIDNKIEQAMDLVKSHLMYAVREEVEVLKEHIKELYERNSVLERENALLKSLASSEQLGQLSKQLTKGSNSTSSPLLQHQQQQQQHYPLVNNNINNSISHLSQSEGAQSFRHQPNITTS